MNEIRGKTVCVTGAAGFLGSSLCLELVARKCQVIALDNFKIGDRRNLKEIEDRVEIVTADVRDLDALKEHIRKSQIIFHLAGIDNRKSCQKNFELAFDVNIRGTFNVLSLCSNVERVVFTSSNMVYGESRYLPIDEKHPLDGYEPYAVTKIACEYLFKAYDFIQSLPFTIVRNFNTFGPRQSPSSLIPTLIIEGLTKKQIEIWTTDVVRDFQYVDNCIDALIKVAESESTVGETVNLGTGRGITLGEVADMVSSYLHTTWVDLKKSPPVSHKHISDITKIKQLTGWEPKVNFEEGLQRTFEYYKSILKQDSSGKKE